MVGLVAGKADRSKGKPGPRSGWQSRIRHIMEYFDWVGARTLAPARFNDWLHRTDLTRLFRILINAGKGGFESYIELDNQRVPQNSR
jgi:hypothetical protein